MLKELQIKDMIYEIRGKQVMLDSDLAKLYGCKNGTKEINQAVRNNMNKFPYRYSWKLNEEELNYLRSNFLTANVSDKSRSTPRVFTEQGVAMLATILKTEVATNVSIQIMDAFVAMRHYISSGLVIGNVDYKLLDHDKRISMLEHTFDSFKEKNNHIFFEGQIYDAYSLLLDIFNQAKEEIIIIDNYVDKKLLDVLSKIDKKIIIYSKNYNQELINKYNKEYTNVICKYTNRFHDRFIIIDNIILYHSGASFKDLGNKCFALNKIEDVKILKEILEELN